MKKTLKKSIGVVMIIIIITPNTDNLLVFFIVFEWGRFLENAMDNGEAKFNVKLCPKYFSLNVPILAVVFCRQI